MSRSMLYSYLMGLYPSLLRRDSRPVCFSWTCVFKEAPGPDWRVESSSSALRSL